MWLSYLLFVLGAIFAAYFIVAICNSLGEFFRESWNDSIAPEVERYRQRHVEQHTTCKGCLHEGENHGFDAYIMVEGKNIMDEGEMKPCYRKRPWYRKRWWREKRGKP